MFMGNNQRIIRKRRTHKCSDYRNWTVRVSNPGEDEILHTHPERTLGPTQPPVQCGQDSFPGIKRPGCGVGHPTSSRAEVKERVQLYIYPHLHLLWHVTGNILPFTAGVDISMKLNSFR